MKELFEARWENKVVHYRVDKEFTMNNEEIWLTSKELSIFSSTVYNSLRNTRSVKTVTNYLNAMSEIMIHAQGKISWITPKGLKVHSTYQKISELKTKIPIFSTSKPVTLHIPTGEIDIQKSIRAFLANLVHSLDGSNIHLLVDLMKYYHNEYPIYTIHDCFATTPNNIVNIEVLIKEAFIHIYFTDHEYLRTMHINILGEIKQKYEITEPLAKGKIIFGNYEEIVTIKDKTYIIPKLPYPADTNLDDLNKQFIKGIRASNYFIYGIRKSPYFVP